MRKKNILILIAGLQGGGAEKVAATLSIALSPKYRVFIALFNTSYGIGYPYEGEIINLDAPGSENSASNSVFYRIYRFLLLSKRLWQMKRKYRIDVSISFLDNANMVNLFSKNNGKTIISVRSNTSTYHAVLGFYGKIYSTLARNFFNRADAIVVPSYGIQEDLVNMYHVNKKKIKTINNSCAVKAIEKSALEPINEEYSTVFENPVIIQVGRITYAKGQWHLIRIFNALKKQNPSLKLVIIGACPTEEASLKDHLFKLLEDYKLRAYAAWEPIHKYELTDCDVLFLGNQKNPFRFLAKSSLYCLTSLFEGFPNALVEAMATGLPVVASDCLSGPREILSSGSRSAQHIEQADYADYGILMPVLDGVLYTSKEPLTASENIWVKVVTEFLANETAQKKYKELALIRAAYFDAERVMAQWEELIEN